MAEEPKPDSARREERLNEAILACLAARNAGGPLNRDDLLARYADVASELGSFLDDEAAIGSALTPWQASDLSAADRLPIKSFGQYEVYEAINRGGMGVILRCRDRILNRELAVKVLHARYADQPDLVERFRGEAQIASRLQHPGIAPVHELGTLPDGRPYFSMKLIGGRDLAALLRERPSPAHDLPRFLVIFQQVCQAVAYAHSKNVLHRDLKPLNIMVGEFGEVQVMDWGLGKVLDSGRPGPGGAPPQDESAPESPRSTVAEVRAAPTVDKKAGTQEGDVHGTFAYMPPEQARGEVERLDRRCDVFGLGAILCEILTGQPPYVGPTPEALWELAREARLGPALERLEASAATGELVGLARKCLAVDPDGRPADAGAVAEALTTYLNGVQQRLRQAELARAQAEARAAEERRRRRAQLGLAAAVLVLVGGATASGLWYKSDQDARAAERDREVALLLFTPPAAHSVALQGVSLQLGTWHPSSPITFPSRILPTWPAGVATR